MKFLIKKLNEQILNFKKASITMNSPYYLIFNQLLNRFSYLLATMPLPKPSTSCLSQGSTLFLCDIIFYKEQTASCAFNTEPEQWHELSQCHSITKWLGNR